MWQDVTNWLCGEGLYPVIWSAVSAAAGAGAYLLLRRRLGAAQTQPGSSKRRVRLMGLGILLLVLFVLVRVWTGAFLGPAGEHASRTRIFLENALWTCAAGAGITLLVSAIQHALLRSSVTIESRHRIRLATSWIGIAAFAIVAVFIWASRIQDFGVFLGIVGAGLALSLQETLVCIAGWLVLVVRRPFDIGDRIEIDGRVGDVIGISVFQTSMLEVGNWVKADQSTGRMLILPNSMLIRHPLYNYTKGFPFVWDEFSAIVTFESDWEAAKAIMLHQAQAEAEKIEGEVKRQIETMQTRYAIHYERLTPIVYTGIADQGVRLTLRYLSPVRQRRATTHRISEAILKEFIAHERIDFAYPTTRIFRNTEEGKVGLGGPEGRVPPGRGLA